MADFIEHGRHQGLNFRMSEPESVLRAGHRLAVEKYDAAVRQMQQARDVADAAELTAALAHETVEAYANALRKIGIDPEENADV